MPFRKASENSTMKIIFYLLLGVAACGCSPGKKENASLDSAEVKKDSLAMNTTLNTLYAAAPVLPGYSSKTLTEDSTERVTMSALDSLLKLYSAQKYFSIQTDGKSWYFDKNKELRIFTLQHSNEVIKENSIYLFSGTKLIAAYSDINASGQDTHQNRERIVTAKCPACGVSFDLVSSEVSVQPVSEARVRELSDYYSKECNEVLAWLAQAPILRIEGQNCIFQKGSPSNARYAVNSELYEKFILHKDH